MTKSILLSRACHGAIAVLAATASASAARAQTTSGQSAATPGTSGSDAIIVTGDNVQTAPDSPPLKTQFSESTITNDAITHLSDAKSLQTMLASQPSVFAYETGPNGVGANIFFRAFNSGQFAETYDGVSINDIFNGGVTGEASTWNSVLFIPSNVDSVELNRGINNPATNSYNSLGGTINFLPRQPAADAGIIASAGYGSFNSSIFNATVDTGDWNGIRQTISADYRHSDGWVDNTQDKNLNLFYSGRYETSNGSTLSLVAVYDRNQGHDPFEMPVPLLQANGKFYQYPYDVDHEAATDKQAMGILGYKAVISPTIVFDSKVFGGMQNFRRTSYGNPADSNSPYELPDQTENYDYWLYYPNGPTYDPKTTFGSDAVGNAYHFYGYKTWTIGYQPKLIVALPNNTVTLGGNITYGRLNSREFWYGSAPVPEVLGYDDAWDEHDRRTLGSVYLQDEVHLLGDKLTVTPGVKYIYAKTSDHDDIGFFYPYGGRVSDTEHFVAPTIGMNYQATSHLAFNFAFGQNEKLPDISAYYDAVPGTTASGPVTPTPVKLKPEHVNDYELGARFQDGEFSAALDVYREDFSDVFVDQFNSATYETIVTNGGSARYQGVEVQLSDGVKLETAGELKGYVNFAYNNAEYTSNFSADSVGGGLSIADYDVHKGERMADVPDTLLTFGGSWLFDGFRADLQGRYIGNQLIIDEDTGAPSTFRIPSYFVADIGISKTIPLGSDAKHSVKLQLNVDNLFDKYYFAEAYAKANGSYAPTTELAAPGMPRSVMGKVTFAF